MCQFKVHTMEVATFGKEEVRLLVRSCDVRGWGNCNGNSCVRKHHFELRLVGLSIIDLVEGLISNLTFKILEFIEK